MASSAKFRIDAAADEQRMTANPQRPVPAEDQGQRLPEPVYPRFPKRWADPGPIFPPARRHWTAGQVLRAGRSWLLPYLRSRVFPEDFHPVTAYLYVECCPPFDDRKPGMSEDVARRSIDWLYDHGGRVLALMGGNTLLRPKFIHKVVYYAARKGMWVYIATNGRLLQPNVVNRLGDAGIAVFNVAVDDWEETPSQPLLPIRQNLLYLSRKQHVYEFLVSFNINICRNNHDDVRRLTEWAHERRIATEYHLHKGQLPDQSGRFVLREYQPAHITPRDWRAADELLDWLVARKHEGYQMVDSERRLLEMKAFLRMSSGLDLQVVGWNGDGTGGEGNLAGALAAYPGVAGGPDGTLHFTDWKCRAGQKHIVIRPDGTLAPCSPLYSGTHDWGNIEKPRFDFAQLKILKQGCQRQCFSPLNHNLAHCYDDARVIRWLWQQVTRGFESVHRPSGIPRR